MKTDKKLVVAIAIGAALGVGLYQQKKKTREHTVSHSLEAMAATLPKLDLTDEKIAGIDSIELYRPAEAPKEGAAGADKPSEAKPAEVNVLKKSGEEAWDLVKPLSAKANASSVKSLIENLKKLEVKEQIDSGAAAFDTWKVSDDKALRAVFKKGDTVVFEAFFGDSGSRGQMARIAGNDGVFALKGYSKFLYERDTKGWRDKAIFQFDDKEAVKVTIQNANGTFLLEKAGEDWTGKHAKGTGTPTTPITGFKASKVSDMVRAFKGLNATDFGDGKTAADSGLEKPLATLTIELKNGAKYELSLGTEGEASSRWAKKNGSEQIYSVSSWASGWGMAEVAKFQEDKKTDAKKDSDEGDEGDDMGGMPPGMPGMPGMPPGMPNPHGGQ